MMSTEAYLTDHQSQQFPTCSRSSLTEQGLLFFECTPRPTNTLLHSLTQGRALLCAAYTNPDSVDIPYALNSNHCPLQTAPVTQTNALSFFVSLAQTHPLYLKRGVNLGEAFCIMLALCLLTVSTHVRSLIIPTTSFVKT